MIGPISPGAASPAPFRITGETRIVPVDVLRGIAISVVVYLHLGFFNFAAPAILSPLLSWHLATNGYYGVSIFFVISGFLITRYIIARDGKLGNVHLQDFYVRRVSRIVPGFVLVIVVNLLLFALAVPGFTWDTAQRPMLPFLFDLLTFRANVYRIQFGTFSLPWDVLWSLAVEEVFYLFYPLACRTLRDLRLIIAFLIAFVVIGPFYRALTSDHLYGYLACFDLLALGCLTAIAEWGLRGNERVCAAARALQIGGACLLVIVYLGVLVNDHYVVGPTLIGISAAMFIAGCAFLTDRSAEMKSQPIASRFLSHLGSLSYEVYLFHLVLLSLIAGTYHALASASGVGPILNAYDVAFIVLILIFSVFGTQLAKRILDPARRRLRRLLLQRRSIKSGAPS